MMEDLEVSTWDEWGKLTDVIVGHAEHSFLPAYGGMSDVFGLDACETPVKLICGEEFTVGHNGLHFPKKQIEQSIVEMNNFIRVLKDHQITVRRPTVVDWSKESFKVGDMHVSGGFSNKDPRDLFISIGNEIIEAPMGMPCRHYEYKSYENIFDRTSNNEKYVYTVAPKPTRNFELYSGFVTGSPFKLTEAEPCFDAADSLQFGAHIFMQRSGCTNYAGIEWLRQHLKPKGIHVHNIDFEAGGQQMHIDTTISPIGPGMLIGNPIWPPEKPFKNLFANAGWRVFYPEPPSMAASAFSSAWLSMNWLQIDEKTIIIEEKEIEAKRCLESLGIKCIPIPYRYNYELFGSLHCSTLDLKREGTKQDYGFKEDYETDGITSRAGYKSIKTGGGIGIC